MADQIVELNVGAVICATGIDYYDPREASEYGYTRFQNVVNSIELERLLSPGGPSAGKLLRFTDEKEPKHISFIQCVGSRVPERPYCSKICCTHSLKSALLLKKKNPKTKVYILYRDIRSYGFREELFVQARKAGVNADWVMVCRPGLPLTRRPRSSSLPVTAPVVSIPSR